MGFDGRVTRLAWDTLLPLDGAGPLHQRLERALREAIRAGRVPVGSALPPSRALAEELRCSRWAVTRAYEQLVAEGYLEARVGSATRVKWTPPRDGRKTVVPAAGAAPPRFDLAPGLPDLSAFPRTRWLEAMRAVATEIPAADLGYPAVPGYPALRAALAEYLPRCRGAVVTPEDVVITTGVTDGVTQICRGLLTSGVDSIAVEDPGWTRLRNAVRATGIRVVPIPVDDDGLRVDRLAASGVRAVLVAAAHQFPLGVVLAPDRRVELVEWARRVDGIVLEDDYDAEFRYDRRPVAVAQGMAPTRVALLGSLSKTLSPAMGIGWVVLRGPWRGRLPMLAPGPPTLEQAAFARFLELGSYDRQLRRLRYRYRARRDVLVTALDRQLPGWSVSGAAAGLHLMLNPPPGVDPGRLAAAAGARGVRLSTLDSYRARRGGPLGLVLGYGNIADRSIEPAVAAVAAAAADIGLRV